MSVNLLIGLVAAVLGAAVLLIFVFRDLKIRKYNRRLSSGNGSVQDVVLGISPPGSELTLTGSRRNGLARQYDGKSILLSAQDTLTNESLELLQDR